jgi:hypothetical protein
LVVAGVSDCGNSEINVVRSKYHGQSLVNSFFNEYDGSKLNTEDRVEDSDLGSSCNDATICNMVDLHRTLSQDLTFNGLPIDSKKYAPLMLLVPHLCSHAKDSSISFV